MFVCRYLALCLKTTMFDYSHFDYIVSHVYIKKTKVEKKSARSKLKVSIRNQKREFKIKGTSQKLKTQIKNQQ